MLNEEQEKTQQKIELFLLDETKELVIAGRAGTGKTYIMQNIKFDTSLTIGGAFSHAAKNILKERIAECEVHTLAILTGKEKRQDFFKGTEKFQANENKDINNSKFVFVIDEASTLSKEDRDTLLKLYPNSKFIYIGDPYQLPPIEDSESIVFKLDNVCYLKKNMRTGGPILDYLNKLIEIIDNNGKQSDVYNLLKSTENQTLDNRSINIGMTISKFYNTYGEFIFLSYRDAQKNGFCNKFRRDILLYTDDYVEGEKLIANDAIFTDSHKVNNNEILIVKHFTTSKFTIQYPILYEGKLSFDNATILIYEILTDKGLITIPVNKTFLKEFQETCDALSRKLNPDDKKTLWKNWFKIKNKFSNVSYYYGITTHKAIGSTFANVIVDYNDIFNNGMSTKDKLTCFYTACSRASTNLNIII